MVDRAQLMRSTLSPGRREKVRAAVEEFDEFCQALDLRRSTDAILLHLTALQAAGLSGRSLQNRLELLSTAAALEGLKRWSGYPDVERLLAGLQAESPLGGSQRSAPLYVELVHAMVDATVALTYRQHRDIAVVSVAFETGIPAVTLRSLRWRNVRFTPTSVVLEVPDHGKRGRRRDPHVALTYSSGEVGGAWELRRLRQATGLRTDLVFGSVWDKEDQRGVDAALSGMRQLRRGSPRPRDRNDTRAIRRLMVELGQPGPQQLRDRALLLLAFHAALRGKEALTLRRSEVMRVNEGLILDIPGRADAVRVRAAGGAYCPAAAWVAWAESLDGPTAPAATAWAFLQVSWKPDLAHVALADGSQLPGTSAQCPGRSLRELHFH